MIYTIYTHVYTHVAANLTAHSGSHICEPHPAWTSRKQDSLALADVYLRQCPDVYGRGGYTFEKINLYSLL